MDHRREGPRHREAGTSDGAKTQPFKGAEPWRRHHFEEVGLYYPPRFLASHAPTGAARVRPRTLGQGRSCLLGHLWKSDQRGRCCPRVVHPSEIGETAGGRPPRLNPCSSGRAPGVPTAPQPRSRQRKPEPSPAPATLAGASGAPYSLSLGSSNDAVPSGAGVSGRPARGGGLVHISTVDNASTMLS